PLADQVIQGVRRVNQRFGNRDHQPQVTLDYSVTNLIRLLQELCNLVNSAGIEPRQRKLFLQLGCLESQIIHLAEDLEFLLARQQWKFIQRSEMGRRIRWGDYLCGSLKTSWSDLCQQFVGLHLPEVW